MRHRKAGKQLGRNASHRKAMFRNMACSLITHGTIQTTVQKAKELRRMLEPLITRAATNDVATRRYLVSKLRQTDAVNRLLDDLGPRYTKRPGGYLRILKSRQRAGDSAQMAYVLFVKQEVVEAVESA